MRYWPYMIDPRTARDGEDYDAYCRRRWGGDGWTGSLRQKGKSLGLKFGAWSWWPNTLNAHRLCAFLEERDAGAGITLTERQKEERGLALVNKFYELTYERGQNISTVEGAAAALEELGYATKEEAASWLRSGGGEQEVLRADDYAKRDMDIHGVPFFVIAGAGTPNAGPRPVALSGAQGSQAFLEAFREMTAGAGRS